jgi:hypothetical protein
MLFHTANLLFLLSAALGTAATGTGTIGTGTTGAVSTVEVKGTSYTAAQVQAMAIDTWGSSVDW